MTYRRPAARGFASSHTGWCVCAAITALAAAASAVHPGRWSHTSEADFNAGQTQNTVVTNLGDVKLSAAAHELGQMPESVSIIYDVQSQGGGLFLAAGPEGKLLAAREGQDEFQVHAEFANEQLFTLDLAPDGSLLLGLSGTPSRLAKLTPEGAVTLIELPEVRYIWDMMADGQHVYLATGAEGKLIRVDLGADGGPKAVELLDAAQSNLLCLGRDGHGNIYAGSDTDGLVYRVRPRENAGEGEPAADVFVIYDAAEPEIGALLVLEDGTVFAGTADAEQARPGRLEEAASQETGRPAELEAPVGPAPQPAPPDEAPEPGDLPQVPPEPGPVEGEQAPQQDQPVGDAAEPRDQTAMALAHRAAVTFDADAAAADAGDDVEADDQDAGDPPVTAEQRDRLRQVIRQQLDQARRTGQMQQVAPGLGARARRPIAIGAQARGATAAATQTQEGNAVYRIGADGFVTEVFRESVMILRIVTDPLDADRLLVATGNEGQLYRIDVGAEETTIVADLEPQQVLALASGQHEGKPVVFIGTANPASLVALAQGFSEQGTFTSSVLDAGQVSLWGKLLLTTDMPRDTGVAVETRSGNVQDPEQAAWSEWSEPQAVEHDPDAAPLAPFEMTVTSPPARFLQYRLTLRGDGQATSVVGRVDLAYVTPNLKPGIDSIKVNNPHEEAQQTVQGQRPGGGSAGAGTGEQARQTTRTVEWEAKDANNDRLTYSLEYRPAAAERWLPLAKDLTETSYEWQTLRVPDGRYVLRLTASDHADNPPDMARTASRLSDPLVIDNTPPAFEGIEFKADRGELVITGAVADALSPISRVQYAVDGKDDWNPLLPTDLIYDSTREEIRVTISGLSPGQHVVTLRATDGQANVAHQAVIIEVK